MPPVKAPTKAPARIPKYQEVLDALRAEIIGGIYPPEKKMPSEADLEKRFGASRITVGRAMHELRQESLIERRAGSGTYAKAVKPSGLLFGLLIPDLGQTDIFEPICQGMTQSTHAVRHSLVWGGMDQRDPAASSAEQTWKLCQQYIEQRVAGVFFAPLEFHATDQATNARVLETLTRARVPVVLLDRDFLPYPQRSAHDLVGIDNRRAGYLAATHLLDLGCRRVAFFSYPNSAATVGLRMAGYQEAIIARRLPPDPALLLQAEPTEQGAIESFLRNVQPDAVVCANDRVAGGLMRVALDAGWHIPKDVQIAGIDDVGFASLLPVPLTTVHQPCREIGMAAMAAMIERIGRPAMPVRDILLACRLVVRASSGGPCHD